jgi:hypothetical protein
MNNRKIPIGIMVALSIAALSMGLSFLLPALQQQAYAISQGQESEQSSNHLTIPGSNTDDEPTTLTFHDKGHCHQYIKDHPGLAVDKKDCT